MDIFVPFPVNSDQSIHQRMLSALGTIQSNTGEVRDYISIFNHDVGALNNLLNNPSSIYAYHEDALRKQEDYNAALADSKSRWDSDDKQLEIGKSVIKSLSEHKKRFKYAVAKMESVKEKSNQLLDMLSLNSHSGDFWHHLDQLAAELDEKDKTHYLDALFGAAENLDAMDSGNRFDLLNALIGDLDNLSQEAVQKMARQKDNAGEYEKGDQYTLLVTELNSVVSKRQERLKYLRLDWQSQDIFVLANADDLLKMRQDLDNFKQFLKFIEKGVSIDAESPSDQKIKHIISLNKNRLDRLNKAIVQAMSWRIHAASLKKDLQFDDNQYALIKEIKQLVFLYDDAEALAPVSHLLGIPSQSLSTGMDFESFELLMQVIKESGNKSAINKWKHSKWVKDIENENFIPIERRGLNLIPQVLSPLISDKPGWSLGSWTRYYYFQTTQITNDILGWLRKKFLGKHSEFVTLLNESIYQIKKFSETIDQAKEDNKSLNLYHLSQSSAFKDALSIPHYIKAERLKGRSLKPSWTVGVLLKWVPFFNRVHTFLFFDIWNSTIDNALVSYKENCRNIAEKIIQDFEFSLFESIKNKVFLLPPNLLADIRRFVSEYGDAMMIAKFERMNQPIHILKKFKFLYPPADSENNRRLNEDSVHAFLSFARKYWSDEEYQAAEEVSKIILREKVPASDRELTELFHKTKVLYTSKTKEKEFMYFLKHIAHEYVFLTGDQGDNNSLKFLERFYPNAAKNWRNERIENLDDKFIFIHALLDIQPNFERKFNLSDQYDVGQAKLEYRLIGKYIQDLNLVRKNQAHYINTLCEKAHEYVKSYQGGNNEYREIILAIGQIQPTIASDYISTRLKWVFSHSDYSFDENATAFYLRAFKIPGMTDALCETIDRQFSGKPSHLDSLIDSLDNGQIKGVFLAKRLQYLMKNKSYEEIVATELFDDMSNNKVFISSMNDYFDKIIQDAIQKDDFKTLETDGFCHMIERFGSLVNKEAYRILRLKRLLATNDFERIQVYVNSLLPYVKNLNDDLITLDKGKKLLVSMYEEYVEDMYLNNQWHAHAQYLLEHFSMNLCPELLHKVRVLWLRKYLTHPQVFSELASMTHPTLDLKFHQDNKQIPNEDINLKQFYGAQIESVAALVNARLNRYTVNISDSMIQLLNRYLKDPGLKTLDNHHLYKKKMEDFQRARDIVLALKQSNYDLMFDLVDHFIEDHVGQQRLLDSEQSAARRTVIEYQASILESIYEAMFEQIRKEFLSSGQLFSSELKVKDQVLGRIMRRVYHSKLPDVWKTETLFLHENYQAAFSLLNKIQDNLVINNLHLLNISSEDAILLRRYLAKAVKKGLMSRVRLVMSILSDTDPLYLALEAFGDILTDTALRQSQIDIKAKVLSQFENKHNRFDKKVESLTQDIIARLKQGQPLKNLPLFVDKKSSLQITFIQALSPKVQQELQEMLSTRICLIMEAPMPEDELGAREEWECYSLLVEWLSSSSKLKKQIEQEVTPCVDRKLTEAREYFRALESTMDRVLSVESKEVHSAKEWGSYLSGQSKQMHMHLELNTDVLDKERQLLQLSMFTRLFGSHEQKCELDELLQNVLIRLRRAMMDGQSDPFREHCIKFAEKLVTLTGNKAQSEQCARLISLWNKFTAHEEMNIDTLKSMALKESLPVFLKKFDNDLFQYFIDKYHLSDGFVKFLEVKLRTWPYEDGHFDFTKVKKQHTLKDFKSWMEQHKVKKRFLTFGGKVNDRAAKKLYVAFCLSAQAHQIARILEQRIAANDLHTFNIKLFTDVLTDLNEKVNEDLGFSSKSLEKHFFEVMGVDIEYFVSWEERPTTLTSSNDGDEAIDSSMRIGSAKHAVH
tara:strand:- start:185039 stop:190582 length:5544 start_codon:yes stop_codon:yes gene_type:complete